MEKQLRNLAHRHVDHIRSHFDKAPPPNRIALGYRRILAHYYNLLIPETSSVLEIGCGGGELLAELKATRKTGIDFSSAQITRARARLPEAEFHTQIAECLNLPEKYDIIIISDTLNFVADAQELLEQLTHVATPSTRLLINYHNNLWRPIHWLAELTGLRRTAPTSSWLAAGDVNNFLQLSGWESIKRQPRILWPLPTPILAPLLNRIIAPLISPISLSVFEIARLNPANTEKEPKQPTASIVIPARNEAGNIQAAVERIPDFAQNIELIFIEGNSKDNTWEEIERVRAAYPHRRIVTMRQTGKGKGNAVREAFAIATGDILMILDADLTMPPEELPKFYDAIASGHAEFANGSRLVYPMDEKAMQFLNMIANHFFGAAFTWLLGQRVKDTLCGTKVLRRDHYQKIAANRAYFGEFDPFGDFDLLFGADKLNLKIRDIPIRYRERTYGTTNINRWSHGLLLFRMLAFAARKLKFV